MVVCLLAAVDNLHGIDRCDGQPLKLSSRYGDEGGNLFLHVGGQVIEFGWRDVLLLVLNGDNAGALSVADSTDNIRVRLCPGV